MNYRLPNFQKLPDPVLKAHFDGAQAEWERRAAAVQKPRMGKPPNPEPIRLTVPGLAFHQNGMSGLRGMRHTLFLSIQDGMTVDEFQTMAAPLLKTVKTRAGTSTLRNRALVVLRVFIARGLITVKGMKGKK